MVQSLTGPGLIGNRVLPATNVPCTYLTHHTYVGVHLGPQAYLHRAIINNTEQVREEASTPLAISAGFHGPELDTCHSRAVPPSNSPHTAPRLIVNSAQIDNDPDLGSQARSTVICNKANSLTTPTTKTPRVPLDYCLVAQPTTIIPDYPDHK
jgi:hypothetical protein